MDYIFNKLCALKSRGLNPETPQFNRLIHLSSAVNSYNTLITPDSVLVGFDEVRQLTYLTDSIIRLVTLCLCLCAVIIKFL